MAQKYRPASENPSQRNVPTARRSILTPPRRRHPATIANTPYHKIARVNTRRVLRQTAVWDSDRA